MASFSNVNKASSPTFKTLFRRGKEPTLETGENIGDRTFVDEAFIDGTKVGDATFDQFDPASWSNVNRN